MQSKFDSLVKQRGFFSAANWLSYQVSSKDEFNQILLGSKAPSLATFDAERSGFLFKDLDTIKAYRPRERREFDLDDTLDYYEQPVSQDLFPKQVTEKETKETY